MLPAQGALDIEDQIHNVPLHRVSRRDITTHSQLFMNTCFMMVCSRYCWYGMIATCTLHAHFITCMWHRGFGTGTCSYTAISGRDLLNDLFAHLNMQTQFTGALRAINSTSSIKVSQRSAKIWEVEQAWKHGCTNTPTHAHTRVPAGTYAGTYALINVRTRICTGCFYTWRTYKKTIKYEFINVDRQQFFGSQLYMKCFAPVRYAIFQEGLVHFVLLFSPSQRIPSTASF